MKISVDKGVVALLDAYRDRMSFSSRSIALAHLLAGGDVSIKSATPPIEEANKAVGGLPADLDLENFGDMA